MATKPELYIAKYADDVSSAKYNENFDKLNDYIEAISEELTLKVNTINSQLSSNVLSSLQLVYPIGSIYIGVTEACPIANLFGTWEKIEEGLCLQSVKSNQVAGTTVEAGLPNITGKSPAFRGCDYIAGGTGAIYMSSASSGAQAGVNTTVPVLNFDASRSSSIYGKSSTVQPPAYVVNIWKRTA